MSTISLPINISRASRAFFTFAVLMAMYASMQLYFTWFIPQSMLMVMYYVAGCLYLTFNKLHITKKRVILVIIIIFTLLYEYRLYEIDNLGQGIIALLYIISRILMVVCLILSRTEFMYELLKIIIRVTAVLLVVSLFFWMLFLLGLPLPHYYVTTNNFYEHSVYYFFILNGVEGQLIPRFAGLFLEPGHAGSTSCLLLFLNGVTIRKWENVVFYITILLSLSLAAYGLLVGCLGLYLLVKSKKGILKVVLYICILALIALFFANYKGGENPINQKILMRLVFENGEMAGSNRTSRLFDLQYERYIHSSDSILGKGREAMETHSTTSILNGCASWKRYFFLRGYVGSLILLLFLFSYLYAYQSKYALAFLVLYLVCNAIRDYPLDELWLYLVVLSMPVYKNFVNCKKMQIAQSNGRNTAFGI